MDRPILFSTPLVRPTIDGIKTVTRRMRGLEHVNEEPWEYALVGMGTTALDNRTCATFQYLGDGEEVDLYCPYGGLGDRLWVRETFLPLTHGYAYKADDIIINEKDFKLRWKPSIHMPRKASRIDLELVSVCVERLHDITEAEAQLEGVERGIFQSSETIGACIIQSSDGSLGTYLGGFQYTWINLNGRESWDKNPWVWRLHFKLLKCTTP